MSGTLDSRAEDKQMEAEEHRAKSLSCVTAPRVSLSWAYSDFTCADRTSKEQRDGVSESIRTTVASTGLSRLTMGKEGSAAVGRELSWGGDKKAEDSCYDVSGNRSFFRETRRGKKEHSFLQQYAGRSVVLQVGRSAGRSVGLQVGRSAGRSVGLQVGRSAGLLCGRIRNEAATIAEV
ncbi:hypothetical protein EYF80_020753 [Liparis tanakae]|uniref:Uncharacterized protein n=1 Tax=Liparis tanakae TaxID=230148 RepID=A0A4Z2HTR8_9TELE|nr:hypothetical protein EYF80_020753 [Liparis tanakae]